jgi:hypothetical protein
MEPARLIFAAMAVGGAASFRQNRSFRGAGLNRAACALAG